MLLVDMTHAMLFELTKPQIIGICLSAGMPTTEVQGKSKDQLLTRLRKLWRVDLCLRPIMEAPHAPTRRPTKPT